MLNNDKEEFLNFAYDKDSYSYIKAKEVFEKVEPYEIMFGKDVSQFSIEELLQIFDDESVHSKIVITKRALVKYIDYQIICKKSTYRSNPLTKSEFKYDKLYARNTNLKESLKKNKYISPGFHQVYLDLINRSINKVYYKTIYLSIYEGLTISDLVYLKSDDIDYKHNVVINSQGVEVKVSSELIDLLTKVSDTKWIYGENRSIKLNFRFGILPIKTAGGKTPKYPRRFLTYIISEHIGALVHNTSLTETVIRESGIFNYLLRKTNEDNVDLFEEIEGSYDVNKSKYFEAYLKQKGDKREWRAYRNNKLALIKTLQE